MRYQLQNQFQNLMTIVSLSLGRRPCGARGRQGRGRFGPQHLPHLSALLVAKLGVGVGGLLLRALLCVLLGRAADEERRWDLARRRRLELNWIQR